MRSHWNAGKVEDLIGSLESGVSVNGEDRLPNDDEPAVLKVSAVTYGVFNPSASKPILEKELKKAKCSPKKGQIIISRSNTPDFVGATVFIDHDYPHRFLSDKLWQTIPKKDVSMEMKWLAYFFASPWTRYRLSRLATGTSKSMKNITKEELLSLPLPIPPIYEQTAIADLLSTWDQVIEKAERLIVAKETRYAFFVNSLIANDRHHRGHIRDFTKEVSKRNGGAAIDRVLVSLTIMVSCSRKINLNGESPVAISVIIKSSPSVSMPTTPPGSMSAPLHVLMVGKKAC